MTRFLDDGGWLLASIPTDRRVPLTTVCSFKTVAAVYSARYCCDLNEGRLLSMSAMNIADRHGIVFG